GERRHFEARKEHTMNRYWQTRLQESGKQERSKLKCSMKSWRSLRESNPSFQIENLNFSELLAEVGHSISAKSGLTLSMGCDPIAKQTPARGRDRPSVSGGASPVTIHLGAPAEHFMLTYEREQAVPLLCVPKKMPPGCESGGANFLNQDGANISGSRQN